MERVGFYALAVVALFAAAIVVTRRSITHSVIAFSAVLFAVAGIFLMLRAATPFALQMLLLLMLVVALLYFPNKRAQNELSDPTAPQSFRVKIVAVSIAIFLLAQIAVTVFLGSKLSERGLLLLAAASSASQTLKISEVLRSLLQNYLLPCEIVVVLLLMAGVARNAIRRKDA